VTSGPRVFLAAPYSQFIDAATGTVTAPWRQRLDALRMSFLARGAHVFSAHHNESWGEQWLAADLCTPIDHNAIRQADVVCAVIGNPPSGGVMIELGWASALHVPCLLVLPKDGRFSPLVAGLNTIVAANHVSEPLTWDSAEVTEIVNGAISLLSRPAIHASSPTISTESSGYGLPTGYCSSSACSHDPVVEHGEPAVSELLATSASPHP
jgi:nucleoside 2-deoxyribosyltransferase